MSERCPICKRLFNSTHDFYPMACDRCDLPAKITRLRELVESAYYEGARNRIRAERGVPTVELWALSESKRKSEGER